MKIHGVLEVIRSKYQARQDSMDDEGWKTIKGTHVMVGEGGDITHGPEKLRGWNTARREKARQAAAPKVKRVSDCKTASELREHLRGNYKLKFSEQLKKILYAPNHFESIRSIMKGFEDVMDEIPELKNIVNSFTATGGGVLGSSGREITVNPKYTENLSELKETCERLSADGYWPSNSSPASIMVHELGHCVEWALVEKMYSSGLDRRIAWNKCTVATQVVGEAVKQIKKTEFGKGKKMAELQASISRYARTNKSEALAEAFADCYANGDNANPLSKAIKAEAIRRLRA